MASTYQPANLTVMLTSKITLNGQEINSENEVIIPNITGYDKRVLTIPETPETSVAQFTSGVSAGTYIAANIRLMSIVNLDNANFVRIRVSKATAETFDIKLEPGQMFIMSNVKEFASSNAAAFTSFVDATAILAQADTAAVNIQLTVATI